LLRSHDFGAKPSNKTLSDARSRFKSIALRVPESLGFRGGSFSVELWDATSPQLLFLEPREGFGPLVEIYEWRSPRRTSSTACRHRMLGQIHRERRHAPPEQSGGNVRARSLHLNLAVFLLDQAYVPGWFIRARPTRALAVGPVDTCPETVLRSGSRTMLPDSTTSSLPFAPRFVRARKGLLAV
jgi:hypothetical protein